MLPAAKKFRYTGIAPELEEKMDKMFSSVVATGEKSWIPSMREMHPMFSEPEPISDDDDLVVENIATPPTNMNDSADKQFDGDTSGSKGHDAGSTSKTSSGIKRFRKGNIKDAGIKEVMMARVEGLLDVTRSVGLTVAAPLVPPSIYMLSEAVHELEKFSELFNDTDMYDFATLFFINLNNRIIFLNLPDDKKVSWLKKRYMESLK
ncbi:hypothetical protein KSP40_PGU011079 [Platanthera guangdongensis]|uniref:Uncharacterized protein n=1 Tax=Platanthera guangdongensis TaxID=2320717 RepID=A0ABR2MRG6_9ASPA